jgi:hypothetical protein
MDVVTIASPNGLGADRHPAAVKYITDNKIGESANGD